MLQTLAQEEIEMLLHQQYIARLGCHAEGRTYVVPIAYAYDGVYLYGHSYAGTKISMMQENPEVCLEMDSIDDQFNWKSVIAWGSFELLTTGAGRQHAHQLMMRNAPAFLPPDLTQPEVLIFRIKLTEKSGRFNKRD